MRIFEVAEHKCEKKFRYKAPTSQEKQLVSSLLTMSVMQDAYFITD